MENRERMRGQKERMAGRLLLHMADLLSEKGLISEEERTSIKKAMIRQTGGQNGAGRDL